LCDEFLASLDRCHSRLRIPLFLPRSLFAHCFMKAFPCWPVWSFCWTGDARASIGLDIDPNPLSVRQLSRFVLSSDKCVRPRLLGHNSCPHQFESPTDILGQRWTSQRRDM